MSFIYFFFIFIFFIQQVFSEKCVNSFECVKDKICGRKFLKENKSFYSIQLGVCSMVCDVFGLYTSNTQVTNLCQNANGKLPSYNGGKCIEDRDCLYGVCHTGKCQNSLLNDSCQSHEDCPLNSACISGNCKEYKEEEETCTSTFECGYNYFCNNKTKKCQKLFSVKDGEEITGLFKLDEDKISNICESGGYVAETEGNKKRYFCDSLISLNEECITECEYRRKSNNEIFRSKEQCKCGFNKYMKKYCVIGNGEKNFTEFMNMKKIFYSNKKYTKYCHTLERTSNNLCNELINYNRSIAFRTFLQEYNNKKIYSIQAHRLKETEDCIKRRIFGYNDSYIIPDKQSCPAFSCSDSIKNCLIGNNPFNEDGKGITVKLNPNICFNNEYCKGKEEMENIFKNKSLYSECFPKEFLANKIISRLPGEDCERNEDCINTHNCTNGICQGSKENEACKTTRDCFKGYFCLETLKICVPQRDEGEECADGYDCKNYLACYNKRCIKFGSLKSGMKNTKGISNFANDSSKNVYLCQSGQMDGINNDKGDYCTESTYDKDWMKQYNITPDDKGYIKCEYGSECVYTKGKKKGIKKKCECGYNSEGQGYCPLPYDKNPDNWKKLVKFYIDMFNNDCHSYNRFDCYKSNTSEKVYELKRIIANTEYKHLYYKSVPCAEKVFVEGNFLVVNISFIIYFLIILFN